MGNPKPQDENSRPQLNSVYKVGDVSPIGGMYRHSCGKIASIARGRIFPIHTNENFEGMFIYCDDPHGEWTLVRIWQSEN